MDSGFSSGTNLTWLIEMGYQVNTKVMGGLTTTALRKTLAPEAAWTRVGDNAEMVSCTRSTLRHCAYPVRLAMERFKVRDTYQYATLLQFRDDGNPKSKSSQNTVAFSVLGRVPAAWHSCGNRNDFG